MKQTLVFAAAAAMWGVASAQDVNLTTGDNAFGQTSFTSAERWTPQIAPNSPEGAACDYYVAANYLRTPGTSDDTAKGDCVWKGKSLTIGRADGSYLGHMTFKSNSPKAKVQIADLRLRTGHFEIGDANVVCYLTGNITLTATRAKPFYVRHNASDNRFLTIESTIVGARDTGLRAFSETDFPLEFAVTGTNLNYLGNFRIENHTTLIVADKSSLGGAPDTLDAEKVVLDGGAFRVSAAGERLAASDNMGLAVTANGGAIDVPEALTLDWPVKGSGAVTKKGAGLLTLGSASWEPKTLVVEGGAVAFADTFAAPEGFRVVYGDLTINVPADTTEPLVEIPADATFLSERPLFTLNLLAMPTVPEGQLEKRIPVMTVPESVRPLRYSDFACTGAWSPTCTRVGAVVVEKDADGL